MLVHLAKWGNSLAVRIPAAYAREIGVIESSQADLSVEDGKLVLKPIKRLPNFDLETLVAGITDENRHAEVSTGAALGDEFS